MGPEAGEGSAPVVRFWKTLVGAYGQDKGWRKITLVTSASWAEENPAEAAEEGAESWKQEGRGASQRLKRRGRRTRK